MAAFLRCLHASIEYAPSPDLKSQAIKNVQELEAFKTITQLCDACDWEENVNMAAKYLRVMRHCIEIPLGEDFEDEKKLVHYETIATVLQKALAQIVDKMQKGMQLTDGDTITVYELSLTFYIIINQANNFNFSQQDLVEEHTLYEKTIYARQILRPRDDRDKTLAEVVPCSIYDINRPPELRKCTYRGYNTSG